MTIPRTRRYPRRPITKVQVFTVHRMPTDAEIAAALAQRYGKRAAHAWARRPLALCSSSTRTELMKPPSTPTAPSPGRKGPEGTETADDTNNAAYWFGYALFDLEAE